MKKSLFVLAIIYTLILGGCSNTSSEIKSGEVETHTITDMDGTEVEVPIHVKKVVNAWPASTSAMLALGAEEYLISVPEFNKTLFWSERVFSDIKNLPSTSDNMEEVLALAPDVVIVSSQDDAEKYKNAGIPAVNLFFKDYESMKKSFAILGQILGDEYSTKADVWAKMVDDNIAEVQQATSSVANEDKPVVYYIQGQSNKGLYSTFAANSIMNDWVTYGGGIFASTLLDVDSNEVTPESILQLNPDIVIIGGPAQHDLYEELMADEAWKDINAIKNGKVYINPNGLFPWERFGLESAMQIKFAASVIHPDLYQVDMVKEVKDFYKLFNNTDLTDEEAENMLKGFGPHGEQYQLAK